MMYDIEVFERKRPARPAWQKPVAFLYIALIPSVIAVNYVWTKSTALLSTIETSADTIADLQKQVNELKFQLNGTGAQAPNPALMGGVEPAALQAVVPQATVPVVLRPVQAIPPMPMVSPAPPVPVITRTTSKNPAPAAARIQLAEAEPAEHKPDIPEAGKFTLIGDDAAVVASKNTVKLARDR